jgi:hypothetical protein
MRINPLKTLLCALFCALGIVCLSGCVDPVDLEAFVQDEDVLDIIEKATGIVNVSHDSDPGLEAGNKKITGLGPDKYYMVEEWDENGGAVSVQFVSPGGERSEILTGIGVVSGGEITGLTNYYNYRVRAAKTLPGDVTYNSFSPPGSDATATNTGGVIELPGPESGYHIYTFTPPPPPYPPYDVVEISVSPVRPVVPALLTPAGEIYTWIGGGEVKDYVFVAKTMTGELMTNEFYVLKVASVAGPPPPSGPAEININVTLSFGNLDSSPTVDGSTTINYSLTTYPAVNININNANTYDNYTTTGIEWYINNEKVNTGFTLNLQTLIQSDNKYTLEGTFTITVEATKDSGSGFYSTAIEVTVTN